MSEGSEHILLIKGVVDFSTAKKDAAAFRAEQASQPVPLGSPGAGAGASSARAVAERAAMETSAVRMQQASSDARNALTTTAAQQFINESLTGAQVAGNDPSAQMAMARFLNPAGAKAFDQQQKEAARVNASESARQTSLSRYGEGREFAYENRIAADDARKERLGDAGLRRASEADRAGEKAADRQESARIVKQFRAGRSAQESAESEAASESDRADRQESARAVKMFRRGRGEFEANERSADQLESDRAVQNFRTARSKIAAWQENAESGGGGGNGEDDEQTSPGAGGGGRGGFFGGGGGSRGRLFGLRLGRLGQYATLGFAALEASRIAQASGRRDDAITLAGNNQRAAADAELQFQTSIEGTPIVGPLVGTLAGWISGNSRVGTQARLNAATATDDSTAQIQKSADYRRQLSQSASLAQTIDPTERKRAEVAFAEENQERETRTSANATAAAATAVVDAARTTRNTERGELAGSAMLSAITFGVLGNSNYQQRLNDLDAADASDASQRTTIAAQRDKAIKENDAAGKAVADAQTREIDQHEAISFRALKRSTQSNNLNAQDRPYDAQLNEIYGENREALIGNTDPSKRGAIITNNLSRIKLFKATVDREQAAQESDLKADTAARNFEIAGDTLSAKKKQIDQEAKDRNDSILKGSAGEGPLRADIEKNRLAQTAQATKDDETTRVRVRAALDTSVETSALRAAGKPIAAQIAEIEDNARDAAAAARKAGGPDAEKNAKAMQQVGINDELTLKRQLEMGGVSQQIQSGSFNAGSGEGNAPLEDIKTLVQQIVAAVAALGGVP